MCWRTAFVYRMRKNGIVTQKNANKREKSVDFVSKKVYSIQALNERASQTSQRNEKSTDRKKKVLDRMARLWYSNWVAASKQRRHQTKSFDKKWKKVLDKLECLMYNKKAHINERNIVPCKLNNVTWTNYKPEILLKFILRKRTGRCKTGIEITASQHIAEIFDYNELCSW